MAECGHKIFPVSLKDFLFFEQFHRDMKLLNNKFALQMKKLKRGSFFWDHYARCYDGLLEAIPYQRLINQTAACVPAGACTLLDAGCGTGNLLHAIQRRHPSMALSGLDFSEAMLCRAKVKLADASLTVGDLNASLPYDDGTFDVVTCINVLYAVRDPQHTLAELRRILKPGGVLIASSPLERPRMTAFIREHAAAAGWLRTIPPLVRMSLLLLFNALILRRGHTGQYHFMDASAVQELLGCEHVGSAYAGQNWFACYWQRTAGFAS